MSVRQKLYKYHETKQNKTVKPEEIEFEDEWTDIRDSLPENVLRVLNRHENNSQLLQIKVKIMNRKWTCIKCSRNLTFKKTFLSRTSTFCSKTRKPKTKATGFVLVKIRSKLTQKKNLPH